MVIRKPTRIQTALYLIFFASVISISVSRLGFPYSGDKKFLAPHRGFAIHTERQFYSKVKMNEFKDYFFVIITY